ncbi:CBX1 [Mytilus edulis]|uniref:CBX1 n=1 Tax=Mytilus edulis TaxID=6550 RepID=A0A8S3V267_MYTED|nr:CBX1 [Mytilus edulis]
MAASHHNLRPKSDINWRKLCFGEPLPHQKKRAIEQRHTLPETYHIERIIIKKSVPVQGLLYLVKWEGFHEDDSTWEPQSHLDAESMSNFFPAFISFDRLNSAARLFEEVIQQRLRPNNRTISTNLRFDLDVYRYCFNTDESIRIDSVDSLKKLPLSNGWNYKLNKQGYGHIITFPFRLRPKLQMRKIFLRKDDGSVETKYRPIEIVKIISASESF